MTIFTYDNRELLSVPENLTFGDKEDKIQIQDSNGEIKTYTIDSVVKKIVYNFADSYSNNIITIVKLT